MIQNSTILITGSSGFIGRALCQYAIKNGNHVTGISLHEPPSNLCNKDRYSHIAIDLADIDAISSALNNKTFDYVINCGGYIDHVPLSRGGRSLIDTHFNGLLNLIENISHPNLKGFVQIGSSDEYGDAPSPQSESVREAPISPYSLAKTAATHCIQMLHRTENFPAKIVRLFLVYGPGQNDQRFIPQVISGCLKDVKFPTSLGEQWRDFCYIDDIVEGVFWVLKDPTINGEVINLASSEPVQIKQVIALIVAIAKGGLPEFGKITYRQGENMKLYANTDKAKHLINWSPKVSLEQGLETTIQWFSKT